MKHPIFYFERLGIWDISTISVYLLVSICILFAGFNSLGSTYFNTMLVGYTIGTHLFLYLFNYRSLRNLTVYLIWLFIGIIHFISFTYLKDNNSLNMAKGHAANGLKNTIILLVIFQILRIISLNTQHQELVAPNKGGGIDMFGERKINWMDYTLFLIYMFCGVGLVAWDSNI